MGSLRCCRSEVSSAHCFATILRTDTAALSTSTSFGSLPAAFHGLTVSSYQEFHYTQGLPSGLKAQMLISGFCNKLIRAFFDCTSPSQEQVLKDLAAELDFVKQSLDTTIGSSSIRLLRPLTEHCAESNRIILSSAALLLQVHYFYLSSSNSVRKAGILEAYSLAETFVTQSFDANWKSNFHSYLTSYLFRSLFMATCVLWKVLSSSYFLDVNHEAGKNTFNRAVSALKKCSIENNDIPGRQSEIMVQLWSYTEETPDMRNFEPTVVYRSRYSASIAYDCLFFWRDHVGGQSKTGLHTSATGRSNDV